MRASWIPKGVRGTRRRPAVRLALTALIAAGLGMPAAPSNASPVLYSFSTIGDPFGAPIFGSGTSVTGTFSYDAATAASGTDPASATIYTGAISGLTGSVGGFSFSDPSGVVSVGNDITLATCGTTPCDFLRLAAEPVFGAVTTPDNLSGFTINGLQLINVRLFWIEGQDNGTLIGDFLSDQSLPPALPGFNGRLGLDFIDPQNPTAPVQFVFFAIHVVPEPRVLLLWAAGILGLCARRVFDLSRRPPRPDGGA